MYFSKKAATKINRKNFCEKPLVHFLATAIRSEKSNLKLSIPGKSRSFVWNARARQMHPRESSRPVKLNPCIRKKKQHRLFIELFFNLQFWFYGGLRSLAFNLVYYLKVQFHAWDPPLNPGTQNLRLSMLHTTPVEPQLGPSASRKRVSDSQCNLKALISGSLTFLCD